MRDIPKIKALLFMKGHSERVPQKNIKPFCDRPLLQWIFDTLTQCRHIDEIILNTDDHEIARLATEQFDVTIHMRPEYLLKITSNEASQIMAYDLSLTEGEHFLQTHSTNPLLRPETIDRAVEAYFENLDNYDSLFSVTPLQKRFFWENGQAVNHDPMNMIKTQDLPFIYEENSCIYIFSRQVFEETGSRLGRKPMMFSMDPFESVDIDEPIDFSIAETLMTERLRSNAEDNHE
ncbi:cytidylyltransferase domain-containing protein [Thermodesulfobacteriota bacterium]